MHVGRGAGLRSKRSSVPVRAADINHQPALIKPVWNDDLLFVAPSSSLRKHEVRFTYPSICCYADIREHAFPRMPLDNKRR